MTLSDTNGLEKDTLDTHCWYASPVDETLSKLQTSPDKGLERQEIERRLQQFGPNEITLQAERTAFKRFVSQFNNLFIYLLLAAGAVTAMLGAWVDSGVILGVVLIIAIIGFIQEGRAEQALQAVRGLLSSKAWVVRDGRRYEISAGDLVPGDIVIIEAGDRVPADLRLFHTKNLQIQEAALTGESTAVDKRNEPVAEDADLGDRSSMAYSGTVVTTGQGKGVVVATGDGTEIGRISGMLSKVETLRTPLMQRLDGFTKVLSLVIIGLAVLTFSIGVFAWSRDWGEMFFVAVSIAVAAIPEGLPAIMTVTLAIGVERMARRNAIIRRLPAVETLGAVTIICSDKTGTLTRNEMTAKTVRTADEEIEVEGVGYEPHGGFRIGDQSVELEDHATALDMIRGGMLCNDAELHQEDNEWKPSGDPTEAALIVLAHKAGFDSERDSEELPRVDIIPFASERRYMATLNHDHEGNHFIYVKGAPERILEMCGKEMRGGETVGIDAESWQKRAEEIADRGQRVLAIARKDVSSDMRELREEDVEQDMMMLGLFGLIDPPRDEAIESVAACQQAGIRVKMITGDHVLTARAVGRALGLRNPDDALTGRDLEGLDDETLRRYAAEIDVFARTSPENKLHLVEALQAGHHVTAMTGDGVNDAPALKRADVGIAMGQKGTEAAREAAAMVLADDNFASIARAVEEGRVVYDNLKKAILFIFPTNAAQALIVIIAILFGLVLPVTPVQILWVNMITAVTLGIALAWEKAEGNVMRRPPRQADEPLLTGFTIWRIGFVGILLTAGAGLLFLYEQGRDTTSLEFSRTVAANALVMGQIFYLLNARFLHDSVLSYEGLFGNRIVLLAIAACLALQLLFIYAPFMNHLFGTEPLDIMTWLLCIGVGLSVFILVEVEKRIIHARRN